MEKQAYAVYRAYGGIKSVIRGKDLADAVAFVLSKSLNMKFIAEPINDGDFNKLLKEQRERIKERMGRPFQGSQEIKILNEYYEHINN